MSLQKKQSRWRKAKTTLHQQLHHGANPDSKPVINGVGEIVVHNGVVKVEARITARDQQNYTFVDQVRKQ